MRIQHCQYCWWCLAQCVPHHAQLMQPVRTRPFFVSRHWSLTLAANHDLYLARSRALLALIQNHLVACTMETVSCVNQLIDCLIVVETFLACHRTCVLL